MKLYRTKNQREYDWITKKLHDSGYGWFGSGNTNLTEYLPEVAEKALLKGQLVLVAHRDMKVSWGRTYELATTHAHEPVIEVSRLMKMENDPLTKIIHERNQGAKVHKDDVMDAVRYAAKELTPGNTKTDKHERLMKHLNETYRKKNKDYGDAFGKSFKRYGAISGLTRMFDKFNRLEELILSGEQLVEDESVLDTLLDLANYSVMLYMELDGDEQ